MGFPYWLGGIIVFLIDLLEGCAYRLIVVMRVGANRNRGASVNALLVYRGIRIKGHESVLFDSAIPIKSGGAGCSDCASSRPPGIPVV